MRSRTILKLGFISFLMLNVIKPTSAQSIQEATEIFNTAGQMVELGDFDTAKKHYKDCIAMCEQLGEEGGETKIKAGKLLAYVSYTDANNKLKGKKVDEAIEGYKETIKIAEQYEDKEKAELSKQNLPKAYFSKGNALYKEKKYSEVADASNAALEYDPNYTAAYYNLVRAYTKQEKTAEIEKTAEKILELESNGKKDKYTTTAKKNLGTFFLKKGIASHEASKYNLAIEELQKSIKYGGENAIKLYQLAVTYNASSQWNNAITSAQKAVEISDKDKGKTAKIYFQLGEAYKGANKKTEACAAYKEAAYGNYKEAAEYEIKTTLKCN